MKKILFSTAVALMALTAQAQTTEYSVTGTATNTTPKVYLLNLSHGYQPIDSVDLNDGRFRFSGQQPKDVLLGVGSKKSAVMFFNDGTPVEVNLLTEELKGSALNEKLNGYDRELTTAMQEKTAELMPLMQDPQMQEMFQAKAKEFLYQRRMQVLKIVSENRENLIPAAFAQDLVADGIDYAELKEFCNPQTPYYNNPAMDVAKLKLEGLEKRAPGKLFTDMTIPDMEGKSRKLSEWIGKGQYVMVDFWASWCGPCRGEMPNVVSNYAKYHPKGFEIVGISFDQRDGAWKNAVKQMGMLWPQLSDLGGWKSAAVGVYGINSIPASILFDSEGRIVATDLRGEDLGKKLQEIYGY